MKNEGKPTWWKLNILIVAMLALLFLITTAHVPLFAEELLQIGVIVLGFALVGGWVYANADVLEAEARRKQARKRHARHPARRRADLNNRERHYLGVKHGTAGQAANEDSK